MTDKPFAVNLMLMMPNIADLVDVLIDEGVKVVTAGAGTPYIIRQISQTDRRYYQHARKFVTSLMNDALALRKNLTIC